MNPAAYREMAETESRHWWFSARRSILSHMITQLDLPEQANILEVGCGTGGNLEMLAKFGSVSAVEMDDTARAIAIQKTSGRHDIRAGHCPDAVPFSAPCFDLICMFDVLEHIEQDSQSLAEIRKLLTPNGRILLTVPAYQWLYGAHDEFLHHKRRYSATTLKEAVRVAGLVPRKISYFNTILFPLATIARIKDKLLGSPSASGTGIPPAIINTLFKKLFAAERYWLKRHDLPFGVSLLCILEKAP